MYRIFTDVGFIAGPLLLGFIADSFNLKMLFYFMAMLLFVNAVLILFFAKETYSVKQTQKNVRKR